MNWKIILLCTSLAVAIGGGFFMTAGFAENYYTPQDYPEPCVCSAPSDLNTHANHFNRYESSLKANLEPTFLMSLFNCQCGPLTCAVTTQAVSCIK